MVENIDLGPGLVGLILDSDIWVELLKELTEILEVLDSAKLSLEL